MHLHVVDIQLPKAMNHPSQPPDPQCKSGNDPSQRIQPPWRQRQARLVAAALSVFGQSPSGAGLAQSRFGGRSVRPLFPVLRYFSITSFVCIAAAAIVLMSFFRGVAAREIENLGERHNVALAKVALMSVRLQLVDFLSRMADHADSASTSRSLAPALAGELRGFMADTGVVKINIYDQRAVVAFSTDPQSREIDADDASYVAAALRGNISSLLIYRDVFNRFDAATREDNLIQTFVPIRSSDDASIVGVFEIYTDVNPMVSATERWQWMIVAGALAVMLALYVVLLLIVRRADRIVVAQQEELRDRSELLARLGAEALQTHESERKKIAVQLHEGVAQTLTAVKRTLELSSIQTHGARPVDPASLQTNADYVGSVIAEVRDAAVHLHPSSLDDLGLRATLSWFRRGFCEAHPHIGLELDLDFEEGDVPPSLKSMVYRVVEETLQSAGALAVLQHVEIALATAEEGRIDLTLICELRPDAPTASLAYQQMMGMAQQRTVLSGGSLETSRDVDNRVVLRASWLPSSAG